MRNCRFLKKTIVVEDISRDPLWEEYKDLPLSNGLQACWSFPIMDLKGQVLGTFAVYYPQPRKPHPNEIRLIRASANLTALAIQSYHVKDDLKKYAEELERSNNDFNESL